jgi:hypothetical protein
LLASLAPPRCCAEVDFSPPLAELEEEPSRSEAAVAGSATDDGSAADAGVGARQHLRPHPPQRQLLRWAVRGQGAGASGVGLLRYDDRIERLCLADASTTRRTALWLDSRATIIASQLEPKLWHDYLTDPTTADAICDRIVMRMTLFANSAKSRFFARTSMSREDQGFRGPCPRQKTWRAGSSTWSIGTRKPRSQEGFSQLPTLSQFTMGGSAWPPDFRNCA